MAIVYGWALEKFENPMADQEKARDARAQWEMMMEEPLPWHARSEMPSRTSLEADRDAFLALMQTETH